ncbi:MAG: hypothetical protein GQ559_12550 [Desulfobulbaceae bacterium]|nr:hypothetical protein [Desulfobulbaceae bacterium]
MQSEISSESTRLAEQFNRGELSITELTSRYCNVLFRQYGTYQEVAGRTGLDRRTVKKIPEFVSRLHRSLFTHETHQLYKKTK